MNKEMISEFNSRRIVELSLPSRFILDMCLDCYLRWYSHDKDKEEILKNLLKRIRDSDSNEFAFTSTETKLIIDSIKGMWEESSPSALELKAHKYLIKKLQSI